MKRYLAALCVYLLACSSALQAQTLIQNSQLANMPAGTLKGNNTGGSARPLDLTASQVRTLLSLVPGTDVQAWDADLDALAALASTGFLARTGSGTLATRTLTAGSGISISNGDGVSGNPVISATDGGGSIDGSGASNQVAVWLDPNTITGYAGLVYDPNVPGLGIGTAPTVRLDVYDDSGVDPSFLVRSACCRTLSVDAGADHRVFLGDLDAQNSQTQLTIDPGGTEFAFQGGFTTFNALSDATSDVTIKGDTDASLFVADASADSIGIGTASPGSKLDIKGTLRLSGATSGYVGLAPAAAAGSTVYTLPSADGTAGYGLCTNGSAVLSWCSAGPGTVTHSAGALTANQLVIGNGTDDLKTLGSLGTTTTVLHGNAAGAPTFGAVSLTADVTGTLPYGNGGTGATSLTNHGVVVAGASALSTVAPSTARNVLASDGTDFASTADPGMWLMDGVRFMNDANDPNTSLVMRASGIDGKARVALWNGSSACTATYTGDTQILVSSNGAVNRLDAGSRSANTFLYVFPIAEAACANPGFILSTSATSPTLPGSYTYKRGPIWGIALDAGAMITDFLDADGTCLYRSGDAIESGVALLTAGTATSYTAISMSKAIPDIVGTAVYLYFFSLNSGATVRNASYSMSSTATDQLFGINVAGAAGYSQEHQQDEWIPLIGSAATSLYYKWTGSISGGAYVGVRGWRMRRN